MCATALGSAVAFESVLVFSLGVLLLHFTCKCAITLFREKRRRAPRDIELSEVQSFSKRTVSTLKTFHHQSNEYFCYFYHCSSRFWFVILHILVWFVLNLFLPLPFHIFRQSLPLHAFLFWHWKNLLLPKSKRKKTGITLNRPCSSNIATSTWRVGKCHFAYKGLGPLHGWKALKLIP